MSYMPIDEAKEKVRDFERDLRKAAPRIAEMNRLLTTYVSLSRRAGLPPEILDMIAKVQQARVMVQNLIRSIQMLYLTTGPIGWLLGMGGIAMSAAMVIDLMEIQRPQY